MERFQKVFKTFKKKSLYLGASSKNLFQTESVVRPDNCCFGASTVNICADVEIKKSNMHRASQVE